MTTENFEDLLDEDGQGTRELDKWLRKHLTDNYIEDYSAVPTYTTGDSFQEIWKLAKEYLETPEIKQIDPNKYLCKAVIKEANSMACESIDIVKSIQNTEQLAIAKVLFKSYQKEKG